VEDMELTNIEANSPIQPVDGLSLNEGKRRAAEDYERQYLLGLMRHHHGNVSDAARRSQLDRHDLRRLLQRHQIEPRDFRGCSPPGGGGESPPPTKPWDDKALANLTFEMPASRVG